MDKERSGGIYCSKCSCCISQPRKRKNWCPTTTMLCMHCHDEKFSDEPFSLIHLGKDKWIVKNADGLTWCGKDGWVMVGNEYYEFTPDCKEVDFSFNELIDFVAVNFETSLKEATK